MKRTVLYIIALLCCCTAAMARTDAPLEFTVTSHDFGTVADDHAPIVVEYAFTNTSDEAVAILSVSTGCGCTRPEYPLKPVAAGEKGVVKVTFVPTGQRGNINKDIKVRYRGATARSSKRTTLRLSGIVTPAK